MKFLVDAPLPRRLARKLTAAGHDATHTLDLPAKNRTPDGEIIRRANEEGRVLVTKDADFVDSFLLRHDPHKLLLISAGNICNDELERLFLPTLSTIVAALEQHDFVELSAAGIFVHG